MRLVIVFILFLTSISLGHTQGQPITEEIYQEKKQELNYDKTKKGLSFRKKFIPKPSKRKKKERNPSGSRFGLEILAYIAIAFLMIAIIYLIFSNVKIEKKIDKPIEEEEIENIEDIDADAIYKQAVTDGNYKLAIRMQFIKILQKLTEKEIIEWKNEKTNRDYIREIKDSATKSAFRTNSNYYEKAWYGDQEVDYNTFRVIDQKLTDFINSIT